MTQDILERKAGALTARLMTIDDPHSSVYVSLIKRLHAVLVKQAQLVGCPAPVLVKHETMNHLIIRHAKSA
jgi:hypothetical protein